MKVHSELEGLAIRIARLDEIRPESGLAVAPFMIQIQQRYQFLRAPDLARQFAQNPTGLPSMVWEMGEYRGETHQCSISRFEVAPEHIAVTSVTSDFAEIVLADFVEWAKATFGFREPLTPAGYMFSSTIVAEFDFDFEKSLGPWSKIIRSVAEKFSEECILPVDVWTPMTLKSGGLVSQLPIATNDLATWSFERRMGSKLDESKIFSRMPVKNQTHRSLLQLLEETFSPTTPKAGN